MVAGRVNADERISAGADASEVFEEVKGIGAGEAGGERLAVAARTETARAVAVGVGVVAVGAGGRADPTIKVAIGETGSAVGCVEAETGLAVAAARTTNTAI